MLNLQNSLKLCYFKLFANFDRNNIKTLRKRLFAHKDYNSVCLSAQKGKNAVTSNINNHSIVTVLSYASSKVVLAGDNEPPSWKELLQKKDFKDAVENADILLAPHHGRDSGFFSELYECFKPKLTIISDGHFCDTSATDRYGKISTGWTVHHKNGQQEKRHCVTTRNDGVIIVRLGYNSDQKPFINVTTSK